MLLPLRLLPIVDHSSSSSSMAAAAENRPNMRPLHTYLRAVRRKSLVSWCCLNTHLGSFRRAELDDASRHVRGSQGQSCTLLKERRSLGVALSPASTHIHHNVGQRNMPNQSADTLNCSTNRHRIDSVCNLHSPSR